jgi:hypothetical protein
MEKKVKSTELTQRNDSYVARYNSAENPYAAFANEGGPGIQGKLLTCKKGTWGIGADNDSVKPGTLYLAIVPSSMRGWLKWVDGKVVDARMGLIAEGFLMPHEYSLPDRDESQWEKNPDGTPRDPWSKCFRLSMIEMAPPHGDVTFSGSSYGAQLALQALCGVYSVDSPLYPGAYPVVALGSRTRVSRSYGKITGPSFDVQGWATIEDVKAGRKKRVKAAKAPSQDVGEAIGDQLPNWGT